MSDLRLFFICKNYKPVNCLLDSVYNIDVNIKNRIPAKENGLKKASMVVDVHPQEV